MHKTYIIFLSSLIACTSWGMENAESNFPSLLALALKQVAKNIDSQVREDARKLNVHNSLTQENVLKSIKNEIALLERRDTLSDKVIEAYKELHTKDNYQQWVDYRSCDGGGGLAMNGYYDKIALMMREKDNEDRAYLSVLTESSTGWEQKEIGIIDYGLSYAMCWGKDDELMILNDRHIYLLPTSDVEGFNNRYKSLYYRSKDDCFYKWNRDSNIFAIEKRNEPLLFPEDGQNAQNDKRADVAIFQIEDGALQLKQIVPCGKEISGIYVERCAGPRGGSDESESLHIWSDRGRHLARWVKQADTYTLEKESSWPDREPDDGCLREFMGHYDAKERSSDILGARFDRGYIVINRTHMPLYEIAKKIVEECKKEAILQDVL